MGDVERSGPQDTGDVYDSNHNSECRDLSRSRPDASLDRDNYDLQLDPGTNDARIASEMLKPLQFPFDALLSGQQSGQPRGQR